MKNININIKATNMELTSSIKEYVEKRIETLTKFFSNSADLYIEVGKTSMHHKNGDYYKAEINLQTGENKFFAQSEKENLYSAVDAVKDEIANLIKRSKDKKQTLFKRGAKSVKKMVKGISSRNPFTSKYDK